jgi:hypothetical protein
MKKKGLFGFALPQKKRSESILSFFFILSQILSAFQNAKVKKFNNFTNARKSSISKI